MMWKQYLSCRMRWPAAFADGEPAGLRADGLACADAGIPLGVLEAHARWLWVRELGRNGVSERPVYLDAELKKQIEGYFALAARRPDLFAQSPHLPLMLDRRAMLSFTEQSGRPVGLVFDNGRFYQVVADLIGGARPFAYARVLYPDRQGGGTVILPCWQGPSGEPLFGLLHMFRHALRAACGGEFPRGFQEPGLTPEQNAAKELGEELGVQPWQLTSLRLLGHTRPDTGLTSSRAQVYLARLTGPQPQASVGEEGITGVEWITEAELLRRLRGGEILDGFTQTAALLYLLDRRAKTPEA